VIVLRKARLRASMGAALLVVLLLSACSPHVSSSLKGSGAIMVQVRADPGGLVLSGASVELQPVGDADWSKPLRATSSGRNGIAGISGLATGAYRLRVQQPGYQSVVRTIDVAPRNIQRMSVRLVVDTTSARGLP
jgi:Carboxypeptidase regulatory-like domain